MSPRCLPSGLLRRRVRYEGVSGGIHVNDVDLEAGRRAGRLSGPCRLRGVRGKEEADPDWRVGGGGVVGSGCHRSETKAAIAGVIGLGLPDVNELGWRWTDSVIYLTHAVPREPTFSAAAVVGQVTPIPLAAIHSTHDEFVPLATQRTEPRSRRTEPKRLWVMEASDHRFSDNLAEFDRRLLEAIQWVTQNQPR